MRTMAITSGAFREKQKKLEVYKRKLKENATLYELMFKKRLEDNGIKFKFQKGFIGGNNFCIADFYIPSARLVIEIDGGYHRTPEQRLRDANKDKYYKSRGLSVVHIWNSEVEKFDMAYLIKCKQIPRIPRKQRPPPPTKQEKQEYKLQMEYKRLTSLESKETREKMERLREKYADIIRTVPLERPRLAKLTGKELKQKYRTSGNGISDKK